MKPPLIFSDPYSEHEVLLLAHPPEVIGVIYHPRSTSTPIPWRSGCLHCVCGERLDLNLHIKREIKMLCTHKTSRGKTMYKIPSNSQPYSLSLKPSLVGWQAEVARTGASLILNVVHSFPGKITYSGELRRFRSPILHRSLKFLFSARQASKNEIASCLRELTLQQQRDGIPVIKQPPCIKIDWRSVYENV